MLDNLYLPTSNDQWLCIILNGKTVIKPIHFVSFFVDEIRTKRIRILKFVLKQILTQFKTFSFHPYHQSSWFLLPLAWGPLQNLMKQFTDLSTTQVRQRIKILDLKMTLYFMSKGFEAYNHSYVHTVICSTLIYLYSFYGYICGLLNLKTIWSKRVRSSTI